MEPVQPAWRTVFDLAEVGYQHWGFAVTGLVLCLASGGLYLLGKHVMKGSHPLLSETLPKAIVVIAVVFTLVAFAPTYLPYRNLRAAYDAGEATVVEGVVSEFVPARPANDTDESFLVGDQRFRYSDYAMTPGFHRTSVRGGPMAEGLLVRIAHVDGVIVRLEVGE